MALALYRRYRPDTFDGIIGQSQVTVPLSRALDEGRLTHAYLFSGPRGCGKTSSARILARCINCAKGPTSHPCGKCESCKDLATGGPGSIDVVEIDAASHNGVEDARELRERASFAPARDRYKIFILDEAHMVTQQGFNALLKIVEEPPEHVMFIFATTEPDKVISTIRSRTHHYPFRLVPPEVMGPYLQQVCDKEGIEPEPGVLGLAMRAGGGSVRDTLSVLDQLMVGAVDNEIAYDSAVALLGFTPDELIGEAIDAVADSDGVKLYGVVQKVVVGGFEPRRFVEDLLSRVRDLLVLTLAGGQAQNILSDDGALQDIDALMRQAQAFGLPKLTWMAHVINTALGQMTSTTSPRLRLELLAASLLAGEPVVSGAGEPSRRTDGSTTQGQGSGLDQKSSRTSGDTAGATTGFIGSSRNRRMADAAPASRQSTGQDGGDRSGTDVAQRSQAAEAGNLPNQAGDVFPGHEAGQPDAQTRQPDSAHSSHGLGSEPSGAIVNGQSSAQSTQDAQSAYANAVSDPEQGWQTVLASLPEDIRSYVSREKVPTIAFDVAPNGRARLSMTFDSALSQHAFALAVSGDGEHQGQKAANVVLGAVRQVFGRQTMIAPTGTAANGEKVVSTNRMRPEELAQVKRKIALAKAGVVDVSASALTTHAGSEPKSQKNDDSGNDGEADDISHREGAFDATVVEGDRSSAAVDQTGSGNQRGAIANPEDDDYDPWLQPAVAPALRTSAASVSDSAHGQGELNGNPAAVESVVHVAKKVAVPDISDGIDPWAVEESNAAGGVVNDVVDSPGGQAPAVENVGSVPASASISSPVEKADDDRWAADGSVGQSAHDSRRDTGSESFAAEPVSDDTGFVPSGGGNPQVGGNASISARFAPESGMNDTGSQIAPEEDEYSIDDRSLGEVTALSVKELSKLFEVKKIEEFNADDPRNPINQKPPERHQEEMR
ncbi:DNA polymerase-3 subunit gamma/tau [Bifidobacterium bohemicum]|uniref:DNA polymerase III subunit gamma/tau n=1 Tax=Bifidobacterium bohemicum TaxID=638617 RepID=UPI00052A0204|nr:DNA polymerase III subunit gamma/tau [Bifidobacterium bohemicum]SCB94172.1 DNA polymerase-3 subunit gamma/tau [Bifidobacterium bohemicum]